MPKPGQIEKVTTAGKLRRTLAASSIPEKERTESERKVICYNPRCADYRVERDYDKACSCKRTRIAGAGV